MGEVISILVAATNGTQTTIGCDGRSTGGDGSITSSTDKKWIVNGRVALGCAGSVRFGMIAWEAFDHVGNDLIIQNPQVLFDEIKDALVKDGWRFRDTHGSQYANEGALLVIGTTIYRMDADYTLYKVDTPYAAIGSAEDVALGAMYARSTWTNEPLDLVMTGLQAAVYFHSTCGGQLWWETLVNA